MSRLESWPGVSWDVDVYPYLARLPSPGGLSLCPAGIQTVVAYQMFVFRENVLGKLCYKIGCSEEFYVFLKILVILCLVDDCSI